MSRIDSNRRHGFPPTSRTAGGQTTTFEYDAENQLILITYPDLSTTAFVYDGAGQRFSRTGSGGTVTFSYDGGSLLAEFGAAGPLAAYTHGALGAVSVELPDEYGLLTVPRYYHPDALGSVHHLTDAAGQVTDNYEFDAFGNQWYASGASPNPHRFVGQLGYHLEPDASAHGLELMKLGARYYDPSIGRFITQDPIGYGGGMNFYAYAGSSPTDHVDPSGFGDIHNMRLPRDCSSAAMDEWQNFLEAMRDRAYEFNRPNTAKPHDPAHYGEIQARCNQLRKTLPALERLADSVPQARKVRYDVLIAGLRALLAWCDKLPPYDPNNPSEAPAPRCVPIPQPWYRPSDAAAEPEPGVQDLSGDMAMALWGIIAVPVRAGVAAGEGVGRGAWKGIQWLRHAWAH